MADRIDSLLGPGDFDMSFMDEASKPKRNRAFPKLSLDLNNLMKRANTAYVMGDTMTATKLLEQVIKERPDSSEAWMSLSMCWADIDVDKSVKAKIMAAHLSKEKEDIWKSVGITSKNLDLDDQALYCFRKAVQFNSQDGYSYRALAELYEKQGDSEMVQESLECLLAVFRLDVAAIKQLAKIYISTNLAAAIELFERLIEADKLDPLVTYAQPIYGDNEEHEVIVEMHKVVAKQRMGYEELNMIAELYIDSKEYTVAVRTLHDGICRLHGIDISIQPNFSDVPLELLIRMAIAYIYLGNFGAARASLINFKDQHVETFAELVFDMGDAYLAMGQTKEAIDYLMKLKQVDGFDLFLVHSKLGECLKHDGDTIKSLGWYEMALEDRMTDTETQKIVLLLLEELGKMQEASKLQKKIWAYKPSVVESEETSSSESDFIDEEVGEDDELESEVEKSLFAIKGPKKIVKKDSKPREKEISRKAQNNVELHAQLKKLPPNLLTNITRKEYSTLGNTLVANFHSSIGMNRKNLQSYKRPHNLQGAYHRPTLPDLKYDTLYEGLTYRAWFEFFLQFAHTSVEGDRVEDAFFSLETAINCKYFQEDPRVRIELQLVYMAIAYKTGNYVKVTECLRFFMANDWFVMQGLRMIAFLLSGFPSAAQYFAANHEQKYFARLTKSFTLEQPVTVRDKLTGHKLAHYAHILLSSKSYQIATQYYLLAKKHIDDPILELCLGICCLHRSSHRTESRHSFILKGMAYLQEYRRLKGECQETHYNVARGFHHVGLLHLAVEMYELVLTGVGNDMKKEAAYNLSRIYLLIGSAHLAKKVLRDHWTL